jgi:YVTN family beta-propeller protein
MKVLGWLSLLLLLSEVSAQQAPWGRQNIPVSGHDRVYAADQTSNTVSVIDPSSNKLLGVIRLGDPIPGALSPLYRGELLVHGLGYSPDARTLAVVSVGSNSVTLIDAATNRIKGKVYVGRSPHEAFFTPDGKELWVKRIKLDEWCLASPLTSVLMLIPIRLSRAT